MRAWLTASIVLWACAEVAIAGFVGAAAAPVLAGWAAAAGIVAIVGAMLPWRAARVAAAIAMLPVLVVLTFEGGTFFIPAAAALAAAAVRSGPGMSSRSGRSVPAR